MHNIKPTFLTVSKGSVPPSWITALTYWRGLHNSMKLLAMPCRATLDKWVIVKSSDKSWSTGGGNGNPLQYSCHENPTDSMKRQKDMTVEQLLIAPERMKWLKKKPKAKNHEADTLSCGCVSSGYNIQLWMCPVVKVNSNAMKNNTA